MVNNFIVIKPKGGLCNRFRFLFSFIHKMKIENIQKKLIVIWEKDSNCNGFIWDIISPIGNCCVLKNNNKKFKIDYSSCGPVSLYKNENYLENINFRPKKYLLNQFINIINKLDNKYISVHIRRTDLTNHIKHKNRIDDLYTPDETFINFMNCNKDYNIYIATDNHETQDIFLNLFPNRIKYIKKITKKEGLRQTNLEDAIIDIFVCAFSNKFQGTVFSSFSDFIKLIRKNYKIINNENLNPLKLLNNKYINNI